MACDTGYIQNGGYCVNRNNPNDFYFDESYGSNGDTSGGGSSTPWWQRTIGDLIRTAPDIISSVKGNPYQSGYVPPRTGGTFGAYNTGGGGISVLGAIAIAAGALFLGWLIFRKK